MQLLKPVRAVTFDVGGTLIEPWPSVGHVYLEVAARFGMAHVTPEALNQRFAAAWAARHSFDYTRAAWRGLVNATFADLWSPSVACFDALYDEFGRAKSWRVFDDVRPALAACKGRGLKLGVISNWDERLRPLLGEIGLAASFDAVVVSHDAGWTKPSAEIFHLMAQRLGLSMESMLHVGDSMAEDFAGAQAAGAQAVLLDRAGDAASGCGAVRSLGQLAAALGRASMETPPD